MPEPFSNHIAGDITRRMRLGGRKHHIAGADHNTLAGNDYIPGGDDLGKPQHERPGHHGAGGLHTHALQSQRPAQLPLLLHEQNPGGRRRRHGEHV